MSSPILTETPDTAAKIAAWCQHVRTTHSSQAAPIHGPEDTRWWDLPDQFRDMSAEDRGSLYFSKRAHLPEWPLAVPAWCRSTTFRSTAWPTVTVQFAGPWWMARDTWARLFAEVDVTVEDDGVTSAGSVTTHDVMVDLGTLLLPLEEARRVYVVLGEALDDYTRHECARPAR